MPTLALSFFGASSSERKGELSSGRSAKGGPSPQTAVFWSLAARPGKEASRPPGGLWAPLPFSRWHPGARPREEGGTGISRTAAHPWDAVGLQEEPRPRNNPEQQG